MTSPVSDAMLIDLEKLEAWLADGSFYSDYDESSRLLGVFRAHLAMVKAKEEAASPVDEVERLLDGKIADRENDLSNLTMYDNDTKQWLAAWIDDLREVRAALSAIRNGDEGMRRQGQDEGFAAAVAQLRNISGVKPMPSHAAIAALLADSLERSRIPCSALSTQGEGR